MALKLKGAKPTVGGMYFEPKSDKEAGNYVVEINRCKKGETRKGIEFFVVETRVLESDVASRPPGSEPSWMVTYDKDAAAGNIVAFLMATTDCEEDEVDDGDDDAVCTEDQPLAGKKMRVTAWNKPTREGNPFTRLLWSKYEEPKAAKKAASK